MPEQELWGRRKPGPGASRLVLTARAALAVLVLSATAGFAWTLYRVLSVEPPTVLQLIFLVLSTLCFAWVSIGSATAVLGFIALLAGRGIDTLELPPSGQPARAKTALLFPVYQEDPISVAATIDTMCREIATANAATQFDVFILSDTQSPADRKLERRTYSKLHTCSDGRVPVYIRWRTPNTGKKSGNIKDWIEEFGAAYATFIILDADSIMSADALMRLAAAMDDNPRAGLIQTVPRLVGGHSIFQRLQQFAGCFYGRILAAGLAAWQGSGGNYWGHNAIIRTEAFAAAAGLPLLPGAPPLGGHILSHDFVEAALLRRAGWEVHLVSSLDGSYEGCPPTLTDLIVRDRRWAQGNLQHLRLLGVTGLPMLSRVHLMMGGLAYLASPVWALTLLVGVVLAVQGTYATPTYFSSEASLFPKWPVFDAQKALTLFFVTVLIVHLPKLLGGIWALRNAHERKVHGGAARIVGGMLVESIVSTLIAPLLMLTQTNAVVSILFGRDSGWSAQRRVGSRHTLMQLMLRHRWHMAWGIAGAAICAAISLPVLAWMSPIVLGLLLAAPLVLITARQAPALLASLLATAEDRHPPALLLNHAARRQDWQSAAAAQKPRTPRPSTA